MAEEFTTETVRMAYRLLLGREAENEAVVKSALRYGSVPALRAAFIKSDEFRRKAQLRPELTPLDAPPLAVEWQADEPTAQALLDHVGRTWTRLGQERPHWSVLSSDRFTPERIDAERDAFFASGAQDRDVLLAVLRRLGLAPDSFPRVFEFGCGLARVTPFLAESFREVMACDVSTSHIAQAQEVLTRRAVANATLRLAGADDFGMPARGMAGSFDLWFSRIVLQHNPPPIMAMVLRRALSLLSPGGIAHFQVPTYARDYRFRIADYLAGLDGAGKIEMHVLPQPVIFEIAAQCACEPLEVWQDTSAGQPPVWTSSVVTLRKRGGR